MPLAGVASVLPVTLRHEIVVELLTTDTVTTGCTDASPVHPVLKNLLLGADVIAPTQYSDAPSVQPVLKKLLLGT